MQLRTALIFGASFVLFTWIAILLGSGPEEKLNFGLTMHQFCYKYGYKVEDITVQTDDGYILTMHRIECPKNRANCSSKRPPVLLLHGMFGSSADFVAARNQSLAFQLADKGYDVWLGNVRGTKYSRDHIMLDASYDNYFWDYSFHEMGLYDLPAMIDQVRAKTNYSKITFVGFSQGCLPFYVMNSLKPEYNQKIKLANLMAPLTTFHNTKNVLFKLLTFFSYPIETALSYIGQHEIFREGRWETRLLRYLCIGPHKIANYLCLDEILTYGLGFSDQKDHDIFPFHFSVSPTGASIKNFQHIIQNRKLGKFAHYNYYSQNYEMYYQESPPVYNVSKTTVPVAVYFGKGDFHASPEGLHIQLRSVPNIILRHKVPYEKFNHMDFIYAKDLNQLVYNKLMETIDIYNNKKKQ